MEAKNVTSDEALATLASEGDQSALNVLLDRYLDGVFDFISRTMRSYGAASELARQSFKQATADFRGSPHAEQFRLCLYRSAFLIVSRDRSQDASGSAEQPYFLRVDTARVRNAGLLAHDMEAVEMVWQVLGEMTREDLALMDLLLRRGMSAHDTAYILGLRSGEATTRVARLKEELEDSVAAQLVWQRGRKDCYQLSRIAVTSTPETAVELRARVRRHAAECAACRQTKNALPPAGEVFSALMPVPSPRSLASEISSVLAPHFKENPATAFPVSWDRLLLRRMARAPRLAMAVSLLAALALAVALPLALSGGDDALAADVLAPQNPTNIQSASHLPGVPSAQSIIKVSWFPAFDAASAGSELGGSGVKGYSYQFDKNPDSIPDNVEDLSGSDTTVSSPPLSPGDWWFHLRTGDGAGNWASTMHMGPFVIVEPSPTPTPTATPLPAPTPTPTATPAPTPTATPAPSPTPTPFPTPTATPSPTPTATPVPTPTPTPTPVRPTYTPTVTPTPTRIAADKPVHFPPFPNIYSGSVFINGIPAPGGALVFARIDGYQTRDVEVVNGQYKMLIVGPPTPNAFGHAITFRLHRSGRGCVCRFEPRYRP